MNALVACVSAGFAYDGKTVVSGLNLEVHSGDCLCVLGENGSGKSTLVKGILGLIKPSAGRIEYGCGLKQNEIGYLPQQTAVQRDFPASVYEVVISGTLNKRGMLPFFGAGERANAMSKMELLGITDLKNACYRELSGGQQQRVLLARALCATSKLLLLDEPVSGLDPLVTAELYRVISELNKAHGLTVIMVSHDMEGAIGCATHILHLRHTPEFFGAKEDYLLSDAGRRFLGGV